MATMSCFVSSRTFLSRSSRSFGVSFISGFAGKIFGPKALQVKAKPRHVMCLHVYEHSEANTAYVIASLSVCRHPMTTFGCLLERPLISSSWKHKINDSVAFQTVLFVQLIKDRSRNRESDLRDLLLLGFNDEHECFDGLLLRLCATSVETLENHSRAQLRPHPVPRTSRSQLINRERRRGAKSTSA